MSRSGRAREKSSGRERRPASHPPVVARVPGVQLRPPRSARLMKRFIASRAYVQVGLSALVAALLYLNVLTLNQVIVIGSALGIVLGKIFCRWGCPMGLVMEKLTGSGAGKHQQLYMYHKLGCPIAWVSGVLNRLSFFGIRHDPERCTDCGKCDQACYITALDPTHSHYRPGLRRPGAAYGCSRCLDCVKACPTASVTFGAPRVKRA